MYSLTAVHVLLSYRCTNTCHHCFVFAGPHQTAAFSQSKLLKIIDQIAEIDSVRWVYFEGGEPLLFFGLLREGIEQVARHGLAAAVVTNGYWITAAPDVLVYLRPLVAAGLKKLQISIDPLHRDYERLVSRKPEIAAACRDLRLTCQFLDVREKAPDEEPTLMRRGRSIVDGPIAYRGRAAQLLTETQAAWGWESFDECPHELLDDPLRLHVDPYGYVHACQGIVIGNLNVSPLIEVLAAYDPWSHPIVGPLLRGGPAGLATELGLEPEEGYVDACHLCYEMRSKVRENYLDVLCPPGVYGVLEENADQLGRPPSGSGQGGEGSERGGE